MTRKTKHTVELTDEEQDEVGRAMLTAALEALGEPPTDNGEGHQDEIARLVVHALAAAERVLEEEEKRLRAAKGKLAYVETEPQDAVATAFLMWLTEGVNVDVSQVSARSVAGARLLGLVQGLCIARAGADAMRMIVDGSTEAFRDCGQGAMSFVNKWKDAKPLA